MRHEIERVASQDLEIALIDRFESTLRGVQSTVKTINPDKSANTDDPDVFEVDESPFGVRFNRNCAVHGSSQVYTLKEFPTGEVIRVQATNYDIGPDNTVGSITSVAGSELVIENGVLVKSVDTNLLRVGVKNLGIIKDSLDQHSEAKSLLAEADKLMQDLTSRYQGTDVHLNFDMPKMGKKGKSVAFIREDTIIFWMDNGIQNEVSYDPDLKSFKCTQYIHGSEELKITQLGEVSEDVFENPNYLTNCLSQLRDLKDIMTKRRKGQAQTPKPAQGPHENISIQQTLFDAAFDSTK